MKSTGIALSLLAAVLLRSLGAYADADALSKLMEQGDPIAQKTCEACHGPHGEGAVGPPLRQNVSDAKGVVKAITEGRGEMPPFAASFSDKDIAAVVTFVRNSWGNSYGVVTEEQVAQYRR